MTVRDHNSSGLLSGVFDLLSRELESFVATATGANIPQVCLFLIRVVFILDVLPSAFSAILVQVPQAQKALRKARTDTVIVLELSWF